MRGPDEKYIHRMDSGYTHGWYVKIPQSLSGNGNRIRKFFSDKKHGGLPEAFHAARQYRNSVLREKGMEMLVARNMPRMEESSKRNQSSVLGVRRKTVRKGENICSMWCAHGMQHGHEWEVCFSIERHGEKAAFMLACLERFSRQGELRVTDLSSLPEIPKVPYRIVDPSATTGAGAAS